MRYDGLIQGSILKLETSAGGVGLAQGSPIRVLETLALGSGTASTNTTTFYAKPITGTTFTYELYTDTGLTTPATYNETYIATVTKQYTSAQTVDLQNQTFTDWGLTTLEQSTLLLQDNGWARIKATVTQGTFTGKDDAADTIPTTDSFTTEFYWETMWW